MGENILWLIDTTIYRLTCGWALVMRVELCEATAGKPHGLSYGMILNDEKGHRILGLDNSHAFDGAHLDDPFDHEHLPGKIGQRFPYAFKHGGQLMTDFFERVEAQCQIMGVPFEIEDDSND